MNPNHEQTERDYHIDHRPGQRDHQFLRRFFRHSFQPRDSADWEQGDVRRVNPEGLGRECVPEFVQHHAKEEQQNE